MKVTGMEVIQSQYRTFYFTPLIFLLFFFGSLNHPLAEAKTNSIVFLSMEGINQNRLWEKGEERVKEELHLSGFDVIEINSVSNYESNFRDELKFNLKQHNSLSSLVVYKDDEATITLIVYSLDKKNKSDIYKEYRYSKSQTGDEADIVSLKAADTVYSFTKSDPSLNRDPNSDGERDLELDCDTCDEHRKKRLVTSVSLLVSGAAVLALGGLSQYRMTSELDDAEDTYDDMMYEYHYPDFHAFRIQKTKYKNTIADAKGYLAGMIAGYALGGTLTGLSIVFFILGHKKKKQTEKQDVVQINGKGITWSF